MTINADEACRKPRFRAARAAVLPMVAVAVLLGAGIRAQAQAAPSLRDLVGVNHNVGGQWAQQLGIGWGRASASWMVIEAKQGSMDWSSSDKDVQGIEAAGDQVVLLLAYTPAWDQTVKSAGQAPPKNPSDWTHFVEAAVSRYSAAPYNVRYFQIWNEPTQKATFWLGTDQQYVDMIYIPAAKIIRQHGCYVVFGGWPLSNSVQELDNVLNYNNAWQWTDYVDMHYHGLPDIQHEYAQWVANGKCRGVWETEFGYNNDPEFTIFYLQVLNWTMQVGWRDPNEFKLFWYTSFAPGAEGDKCLLKVVGQGFQPSMHGQHLIAMNEALGQGPLRPFTQFSVQPPAAPGSLYVDGFEVGSNRTVLQLTLARPARPSLSASVSLPGKPSRVQLMSGLGKTSDLPVQYGGGRLQVSAPLNNGFDDCPGCHWVLGYIVIDR
jgi:hypothetical protein